ncbi:hypothetical protein ALI22I_05510 [Saccharothrix sp. ALI-22-I]|nr:hypothetical protein ALI22I_05510 [Saccharothrix sp. ALI-22-I]
MAWTAFFLYTAGLVVAFGVRAGLHLRATGDTGYRRSRPPVGSAPWWAQVLMATALVFGSSHRFSPLSTWSAPSRCSTIRRSRCRGWSWLSQASSNHPARLSSHPRHSRSAATTRASVSSGVVIECCGQHQFPTGPPSKSPSSGDQRQPTTQWP